MTRPGIEPWSPKPLANAFLTRPTCLRAHVRMYVCVCVCVCVNHIKLLPVEQHFHLADHNFTIAVRFPMLKKYKQLSNTARILESYEDGWILRLESFTPNGLNTIVHIHRQKDYLLTLKYFLKLKNILKNYLHLSSI